MAVGLPAKVSYANGDVFSASDINDTNGTINLIGQTQNFYAGKNSILNSNFSFWQRGTSFTPSVSTETYSADRFFCNRDGTGATVTVSRQSFTPGTAPVSGYESDFFYRYAQTVAGTTGTFNIPLAQKIENVRTFAGQTMTISLWAKADATRTLAARPVQNFGIGGSSSVFLTAQSVSLTTSWDRYSFTFAVPSISGKTIGGTDSNLSIDFTCANNTVQTLDFWGLQVEAGSTATAFEIATGNIASELLACQRYYYKTYNQADAPATATTTGSVVIGFPNNSTQRFGISYPTMRGNPTMTTYNTSTGATSSLRTDTGTDFALGGPFFIGETRAFVDVTPSSGNYGTFHFVASSEL